MIHPKLSLKEFKREWINLRKIDPYSKKLVPLNSLFSIIRGFVFDKSKYDSVALGFDVDVDDGPKFSE